MNEAQRDRMKRILEEAWGLPAGQREAFARREAADDPEVLGEVLEILAQALPTGFLETPIADELNAALEVASTTTSRPQRFGKYLVESVIGSGGNGTVYRARQLDLDRVVAIKVLDAMRAMDRATLDRFRREADSIAKLQHPNIIKIFDIGETDGHHWFAMEYIDGHDLATELAIHRGDKEVAGKTAILERFDAPGGYARCARMIADVADALETAHRAKIVHRDIKPSNLLLSKSGHITVADFGIARSESLGGITRTGQAPGTLAYMSPEQIRAKKADVDHRTDIYSLGVVLYEMLTRHRPFGGSTERELQRNIEESEPKPIRRFDATVPRDLETICLRAMARYPGRRFESARALTDDLMRFVQGQPIQSHATSTWERMVRGATRRRWLIGSAAGFAGLAFGADYLIRSVRRSEARKGYGRLSVLFDPRPSKPGGRTAPSQALDVYARRIDELTSLLGPTEWIGRTPIVDLELAPGYYRIIAYRTEDEFAEYTRDISSGSLTTIEVGKLRPVSSMRSSMTQILGGMMYKDDSNVKYTPNEKRNHSIATVLVDRREVSFGDFQVFLNETNYPRPKLWSDFPESLHYTNRPASGISWIDAQAFAEWASKRLPTQSEWEWIARGAQMNPFPCSPPAKVPWAESNVDNPEGVDRPVFAGFMQWSRDVNSSEHEPSRNGVRDLFGNVWEFTETMAVRETDGSLVPSRLERVFVGCAWNATPPLDSLKNQGLCAISDDEANPMIGFRCVKSVEPL